MSFHEALGWTVCRAALVAVLAMPVSVWLSQVIRRSSGHWRFWSLLFVLCPLVAPDLVVGYSYRSFELSLLHRPDWNHLFYVILVLLKYAPAAAVVRIGAPPDPLSEPALHCLRLINSRRPGWRLSEWVPTQTRLRNHMGVFGIVFLLVMQEFELASLLQIPAWTVHLFDAQAGALQPAATARRLIIPVAIQLMVILPLMATVRAALHETPPRWRFDEDCSTGPSWPGIAVAALSTMLLWAVPLIVVGTSGLSGLSGVLRNGMLMRSTVLDLIASMAIAVPCAVLSLFAGRKLSRVVSVTRAFSVSRSSRRLSSAFILIAILPGLLGSLAVSLTVLVAIQHPLLTGLRSTVWPMATALTVFLIPRALLLMLLIPAVRDCESGHLGRVLDASTDLSQQRSAVSLKWWYDIRPMFLVFVLLFYWSLSNLTAAALLCPPTIPLLSFSGNIVPLPVRLYKFIHQGRTTALSVMSLLSVLIPLAAVLMTARWLPWIYSRFSRSRDARV